MADRQSRCPEIQGRQMVTDGQQNQTIPQGPDRTSVSSLSGDQGASNVLKTLTASRAHFSWKDCFSPQRVSTLSAQVRLRRNHWRPWSGWALTGLWEARVTLRFPPLLSECCFQVRRPVPGPRPARCPGVPALAAGPGA